MVKVCDVEDEPKLVGKSVQDAEESERIRTAGARDDNWTGLEDRMRRDELANAALNGR